FRPATFQPFAGVPLAALRGRKLPIESVLGRLGRRLERAVGDPRTLEQAIARAEEVLEPALPPLPAEVRSTRDLVERIESDRSILRVEDVAAQSGLGVRTLERRFRAYVGVSPKWVIRRYRLMEAVERLKAGERGSLAELAAGLGYFDQPHFVRDFKAIVGRTPSEFSGDSSPSVRRKRS
ncbi:MAG: helix-turn-helix transcriptional regulator, partial [Polyangiaceae bacterium]|nr:helix-turn-helix transcriptional regulator [Polyangiaceae bacterium]